MNHYRLYTIGNDKHFCGVYTLEIESDLEACEIATVHLKKYPAIEVWQEDALRSLPGMVRRSLIDNS